MNDSQIRSTRAKVCCLMTSLFVLAENFVAANSYVTELLAICAFGVDGEARESVEMERAS